MDSISLSFLCDLIEESLQPLNERTYNVRAEISSLSERNKHCYMELVEKSNSSEIVAKIRANCWRNTWVMLSSYFAQETQKTLAVGMEVLFEVTVDFHSVYGLSLNIVGIDPSYTLGKLAQERIRTIERLTKDGVIDMQKSLSLPTLPNRLAIISSSDAAGYQDFCHQLQESGYLFTTKLYKAFMQGNNAPQSIIAALNLIYEEISDETERFDAIIIIRGGGSSLDLNCFDDYELAFHIAQFPLPIITGIGHTKDVSVADLVAYLPLKTPTAVADYFVSIMQEQQDKLNRLKVALYATAQKRIALQATKLERVKRNISELMYYYLHSQQNRLNIAQNTIRMCSPAEIYRKGYSLTTINGKVLKSATQVRKDDKITTEFSDGIVQSIVI